MTYDPLKLIQFALEEGIPIQIIDFGKAVAGVSLPQVLVPPEECSETGVTLRGQLLPPQKAILRVEAPVAVGKDLQQPADQRDCYILIHIPRQALELMNSPIVAPSLIVRPS